MHLDWLIVGGGIHGVHLALVLRERCKIAADRIRIIDPHDHLLARWDSCTTACGMRYLRSTVVHHLAPDPYDLLRFARHINADDHHFHGRYQRPSLAIFQAHAQSLIRQYRLSDYTLQGRVCGLRQRSTFWDVETDQGMLSARHVLLAVSCGEQLRWPAWARELRKAGAAVYHLYEPTFTLDQIAAHSAVAIIGGGISAGHLALNLCRKAQVTLLMRRPIQVAPFDSPPGWMGPKELRRFHAEPDPTRRRAMITAARLPGTMPVELAQSLHAAAQQQQLQIVIDEVHAATIADGAITLQLTHHRLAVTTIILATGFTSERPGHPWLDDAIIHNELPTAPCGYPLIGPDLQWAPGLFVSGPLAELEIGPVARNIIGARHAGERLARQYAGGS